MTSQNPFADAAAGFELPEIALEVDRLALVKYAGAADDYVRQHWDHPFMIEQGYPDVIGHGWLSFAHMCRVVTDWAPPAQATIARYAVRYHRPFHPGVLTCGATVDSVGPGRIDLSLWARAADGTVLATGSVSLTPPA
ncbi:MaoC/PaaZ C-terminal domain-containing protein [Sphingomonas immobilis]|uniref:MaoC/PaaZ C-terminal domain-containing protein n=1 Tax=Sphingomonas immobilis TaxID=3063997 RepID=A0ABT8ZXJ3_9SPHN|nr:MaoC/PaaZ C-terminal domain-containing protein [Sphingomonas sp. CA1-15]MDO7842290.1 MaoC/PaaZ C-terminal domain-containing protein [Sphingomonas sp. CA1-15]